MQTSRTITEIKAMITDQIECISAVDERAVFTEQTNIHTPKRRTEARLSLVSHGIK